MSGKDGKTEKPTPKRLREARREGQTARSREVGAATSLAGGLLVLTAFAPAGATTFAERTAWLLEHATHGDELPRQALLASGTEMAIAVLAPFVIVATIFGLAGGFAQVGFAPAPKAIQPQAKRLNPKRGLQRFKPSQMGWELARNMVKLGLLAVLVWLPLQGWMGELAGRFTLGGGMAELGGTVLDLIGRAAVLAALIAAADVAWTKYRHQKQLMMRKDEVKREHKDAEGDPHLKQRRQQRAQELSANRTIASAADADVVVANPTHFSVALAYEADDPAPRIVGKGLDEAALEMRRTARRHGVPVLDNPLLARGLYRRCRVGDQVPAALFEAVAAVLATAYRLTGKAVA